MKKILKTLFDWSGRALQSQHLRTIVLLAFLVVGADVAWGLGIKRNISMTNVFVAGNGEFTNNVYSWKANYDNLTGDADCGGLIAYNYISGEPVTGLSEGRPMFVRSANDKFNLANFMRANLYASVGVLKIGNDILFNEEHVKVDRITGHGRLFKTKGVGQRILAAAINSPISVMETAGEGGAWGIALLAGYLVNNEEKLSLADYLDKKVFAGNTGVEIAPTAEDVAGFDKYIETYKAGLAIEKAAVENKK